MLRTLSVSVEFPTPILMDPPIETVLGILFTKISCTNPFKLPTVIDFPNETVSVFIPILNESVNPIIDVLSPDIKTESSLLSSINGR